MVNITLKGEPKSTGATYKTMCRGNFPKTYMVHRSRILKEDYKWQIKSQWKGEPLINDIELNIKLYFGTKRKCDWDNFHKLSMDSMTGIVYVDDSQVQKATVEKFYDKENPRIEILLSEYKQIEK